MNLTIARAFKVWLVAEGVTDTVHTGMSADDRSPDQQSVICHAEDLEHVAGPLHKGSVKLIITTPPHILIGAATSSNAVAALALHESLTATVRDLIDDFDNNSLRTVFDTETGWTFAGGFVRDESDSPDENGHWVTTIDFLLGVQK